MKNVMECDTKQLVEAFTYLDGLRKTGLVNMFSSTNYVVQDLGHDTLTARSLVAMWMKSYDANKSVEDRVLPFENT